MRHTNERRDEVRGPDRRGELSLYDVAGSIQRNAERISELLMFTGYDVTVTGQAIRREEVRKLEEANSELLSLLPYAK